MFHFLRGGRIDGANNGVLKFELRVVLESVLNEDPDKAYESTNETQDLVQGLNTPLHLVHYF